MYLLNQLLSEDKSFQQQIALASNGSAEEKASVSDSFYNVYVASSIFSDQVAMCLQLNDFAGEKKAKKSLLRLTTRV